MKGPLYTCLKDRYTLIEQSDLNTLIEQSQYSSEEQCSKLIDKEIWLVRGGYCHFVSKSWPFFFFLLSFFSFLSLTYSLGEAVIQNGNPLASGPHFNSLPWAP